METFEIVPSIKSFIKGLKKKPLSVESTVTRKQLVLIIDSLNKEFKNFTIDFKNDLARITIFLY